MQVHATLYEKPTGKLSQVDFQLGVFVPIRLVEDPSKMSFGTADPSRRVAVLGLKSDLLLGGRLNFLF